MPLIKANIDLEPQIPLIDIAEMMENNSQSRRSQSNQGKFHLASYNLKLRYGYDHEICNGLIVFIGIVEIILCQVNEMSQPYLKKCGSRYLYFTPYSHNQKKKI